MNDTTDACPCGEQHPRNWEGKFDPDIRLVIRIARALGMDVYHGVAGLAFDDARRIANRALKRAGRKR